MAKMYNGGKIILGIIIFIILFTSPLWINIFAGDPEHVPDLKYPTNATECIDSKEHMNAFHMDILDEWRDLVVRDDIRYTEINGQKMEMSLSRTCMSCHTSKVDFCDKCHNYLGVDPYCWDCHVMPDEAELEFDPAEHDNMPVSDEETPAEAEENIQPDKEGEVQQ